MSDFTSTLPSTGAGWWYQLASEIRASRTMTAVVASEENWFSRWNVEYMAGWLAARKVVAPSLVSLTRLTHCGVEVSSSDVAQCV